MFGFSSPTTPELAVAGIGVALAVLIWRLMVMKARREHNKREKELDVLRNR